MKRWLKRNEIFFTTICAVVLSLAAIFFSYISYDVAKRQMDMDYFEKLPDFQISINQVLDAKSDKYDHVDLVVSKLTGKAKNISINTVTIMEVNYSNTAGAFKQTRILVNGFFDTSTHGGSTDGVIEKLTGYRNHLKEIRWGNYLDSILTQGHSEYVATKWKTFVKINYLNFENKDQEEYFDASWSTGTLVRSDSLKKYFDDKNPPFPASRIVSISDVDHPERISKLIKQLK